MTEGGKFGQAPNPWENSGLRDAIAYSLAAFPLELAALNAKPESAMSVAILNGLAGNHLASQAAESALLSTDNCPFGSGLLLAMLAQQGAADHFFTTLSDQPTQ